MPIFKAKKKISFNAYLIVSSSILTICFMTVLSFFMLLSTSSRINAKVDAVNEAKTNRLSEKINGSLTDIKNRTQYLMTNQQILQYIKDIEHIESSSYEKNQASKDLAYYLTIMVDFSPPIERIHVLTGKSQYESISDAVFSYPLIPAQEEPLLKPVFYGPLSGSAPAELGQKFFYTGSLHEESRVYGKIYVVLSDAYITKLAEPPDGYAIIGADGEILINASPVGDDIIENAYAHLSAASAFTHGNFRFYAGNIGFENWKIVYAADTTQFYSSRKTLTRNILISLSISLVLAMLFSSIISKRILSPIKKLIGLIQRYKTKASGDSRFIADRKSGGSLQPRLFVFYILTIFIPILIFMGSFLINSRKTVNSYIEDSYSEIFDKSAEEIDEYLANKRSFIINTANDSYVRKLFDAEQFAEVAPYVADNIWHQAFMGMGEDWIGIYSTEGELLFASGLSYAEEENASGFLNKMEHLLSGVYMDVSTDQLGNEVLSLGVAVKSTSESLSDIFIIGYIKIDILLDFLEEKMENIADVTEALVLAGKNGEGLYPAGTAGDYISVAGGLVIPGPPQKAETDSGRKFVFSHYLSSLDMTLLGVMDYNALFTQNDFLADNFILITAIVLLLTFVSSYIVSRRVFVPINRVNKIFRETSLDTMHENELDDYAINEINELGETYNSMIARIENLIDEVILANESKNRMEQGKKEAEIISLQAQINPHFLYNTLTTINGMIKSGYKDEAIDMVNALSDLFRYGISRGEIIIGMQEEVEHAKAYANIMSFRYKDRLVFEWDIDEEAYRYSTIKLIIQPFIENSINHGVKVSDKVCTIRIKCEVLEESIRITVTDDGMGIEARQLELIKNHLEHGNLTGKIGIYNVQSRLLLHYGRDYGMDIESVYGTGTVVTVLIPKNELPD